ncbi:unnamed protein product [Alternaria alternata]
MASMQNDRLCSRNSRNNTFPFGPMPRQDPPSVRGLADLLGLTGPPGPPRPDAQRELANRSSQDDPSPGAAGTTVAAANRPATGTLDQRQRQQPNPQITVITTTSTTTYIIPGDNYAGPQSLPIYYPPQLGIAPQPALSVGERTPIAQSPQTPTSDSSQIPEISLNTGQKTPGEGSAENRDDIDLPSPSDSSESEVSAWYNESF